MRKIFTMIQSWWLLRFRNNKVQVVEFEAYRVVFRRFTMDIETKSGNMKLRTQMMRHPQSFLLHCLSQGDAKMVEWFCRIIYQTVALLTADQGLANDIQKSLAKYYKRQEVQSEIKAKEVDDDADQIASEIIKSNIAVGNMTRKERKEHKKVIREILTKDNNG